MDIGHTTKKETDMTDAIRQDAVVLSTSLPEDHAVAGIRYGTHVTLGGDWMGSTGYYVEIDGIDRAMIGVESPEQDGDDDEIIEAIREEMLT